MQAIGKIFGGGDGPYFFIWFQQIPKTKKLRGRRMGKEKEGWRRREREVRNWRNEWFTGLMKTSLPKWPLPPSSWVHFGSVTILPALVVFLLLF